MALEVLSTFTVVLRSRSHVMPCHCRSSSTPSLFPEAPIGAYGSHDNVSLPSGAGSESIRTLPTRVSILAGSHYPHTSSRLPVRSLRYGMCWRLEYPEAPNLKCFTSSPELFSWRFLLPDVFIAIYLSRLLDLVHGPLLGSRLLFLGIEQTSALRQGTSGSWSRLRIHCSICVPPARPGRLLISRASAVRQLQDYLSYLAR
ncbi:hypothetical protein EXIGLDRAFT_206659 [Exidia glandulosa HHB12029]|uniref:Uncharacterized protein n=1 Tax=Exidia glandulosa HHB12029 TaxID=1314781 RepID=A0A165ELV7_EXIGL|nr:hypothetical protein EXIGLDRAFT_206659 [Exidia glandulosa HHB12029]